MTPTLEQIKEILANVPEGATHYTNCCDEYLDYEVDTAYLGGKWVEVRIGAYAEPHDLSDLREILTLRQRVEKLEIAIEQSLGNIEYAAFNLCETMDLLSSGKGRVVESSCPEKSLLIAIRDLKEVTQPIKEQDDE